MKTQSDGGQKLLDMALAIVTAVAVLASACDSSASGSSPAANKVDPAIVGTWELAVPNAQGTARWVWEILPNGTYKFHAEGPGAPASHSGIFSASGGRYTLKSTTMDWTDSGTYQLSSPTMLEAQGKLGAALWQRVQTASVQIIPSKVDWPVSGVPFMAQRALAYVRAKWRPDAFLTTIDIEPTAGLGNAQSPIGEVSIKFLFYSPGTQSLLSLTPNAAAGDIFPAGSADPNGELALPTSFLDLPEAAAHMRSHVRGNGIAQAHLKNFPSGSAFFGPAWSLDTNLGERGYVLAEIPDRDEVRMASKGEEYGDENVIHVNVTGLRANSGEVVCSLFSSADGFPLKKATERGVGVISGGSSECDFQGEDTGRYAVAVLDHLNLGSGGVPHGGIGVSNNPPATGGLPTFHAAAFSFRGGRLELTIDMRYQ